MNSYGKHTRNRHALILVGIARDLFRFAVILLVLGGLAVAAGVAVLLVARAVGSVGEADMHTASGTEEPIVVAAIAMPVEEVAGEIYAQALEAEGFAVEREYGLTDQAELAPVTDSDGAYVLAALSDKEKPVDVPGTVKLLPIPVPVAANAHAKKAEEGLRVAPVVSESWLRANPRAREILEDAGKKLSGSEGEDLVRRVLGGERVEDVVADWRRSEGLPAAPDTGTEGVKT